MGFLDDALGFATLGLVGDDPFSSEGSPAQVVDPTPKEFAKLRKPISKNLQGFFGGETLDFTQNNAFKDVLNLTPQLTSGEQQGLQALQNITFNNPSGAISTDQLNKTISGEFLSPDSNPFLQQTIDAAIRPLTDTFERFTLPGLKDQFTRAGHIIRPGEPVGRSSSPFNTAAAFAQGDLLNNIADISSKISFDNFQQERSNQLQAIRDSSQLRTADINNFLQNLQAQALPRLIQEVGLDRGLQQFNNFTQQLLQALSLGGQLSTQQNLQIPAVPSTPGIFESGIRSFANSAGQAGAAKLFGGGK